LKRNRFVSLGIVSVLLFISPDTVWADWTSKGSLYIYTDETKTTLTQGSIITLNHADPNNNVKYTGESELIYPERCMDVSISGSFTYVSPTQSAKATVYERRFTHTGSVTSSLGDGTMVGSNVEYYIKSIEGSPSQYYDLTGTTFGRSDWEYTTTSEVTYIGTTYYYIFQSMTSSGGHVDGDIHGEFYFTGEDSSGHPLAEIIITSIDSKSATDTYSIVWDLPKNDNFEISESNGGKHSDFNIVYQVSTSEIRSKEGSCHLEESTVYGIAISFYLKDYDIGLYLGKLLNGPGNTALELGKSVFYYYPNTPGSAEIAPRVIGLSQSSAERLIDFHGFTTGKVTFKASGSIPLGKVISQSVKAGSLTNLDTNIDLVVSTGPLPITNLNENGKGGGCFIAPSESTHQSASGIIFIVLLSIAYFRLSHLRRKH
jgi:hypothetical protein